MSLFRTPKPRAKRPGGRRRSTVKEYGIAGICPKCGHLLANTFEGDPAPAFKDSSLFKHRCFHCEPRQTA